MENILNNYKEILKKQKEVREDLSKYITYNGGVSEEFKEQMINEVISVLTLLNMALTYSEDGLE